MEDRNAFSWNSLIRGFSVAGQKEAALKLFQEMRKEGIVSPNRFTLPGLLSGAVHAGTLHEKFRSLHSYIIKVGLLMDPFVATSLIAMYSARRTYEESKMAFDDANSVDVGVWSTMITESMNNEEGEKALELFTEMLDLEIKPNRFIFSTLFKACGELSALEMGKQIYGYCSKSTKFSDNATQNSLVNMYSNCGMIEEAVKAFDLIKKPNVISYNSVISAPAQDGLPEKASEQFKRMKLHDLATDDITILNLLTDFNHAGLVKEGLKLFSLMEDKYMIKATYQHHASIVDLLARAGKIDDSIRFINVMPLKRETSIWRIVLGACSKHQKIKIRKQVQSDILNVSEISIIINTQFSKQSRSYN
ncbi:Pentatricopeptide repeat-containing protein [Apostasia shenzhenica]|uniref:Pentatricopeptide repeat-containing protein n=1 Tax=Apostasia shenzhenica TaxID=1088818 RepID=A0A2I0A6R6_9ASPA|nr:Pentatricopeptide repeat-containing protein [Apostasia shenzhenica]